MQWHAHEALRCAMDALVVSPPAAVRDSPSGSIDLALVVFCACTCGVESDMSRAHRQTNIQTFFTSKKHPADTPMQAQAILSQLQSEPIATRSRVLNRGQTSAPAFTEGPPTSAYPTVYHPNNPADTLSLGSLRGLNHQVRSHLSRRTNRWRRQQQCALLKSRRRNTEDAAIQHTVGVTDGAADESDQTSDREIKRGELSAVRIRLQP
jgi:hypothetical protein